MDNLFIYFWLGIMGRGHWGCENDLLVWIWRKRAKRCANLKANWQQCNLGPLPDNELNCCSCDYDTVVALAENRNCWWNFFKSFVCWWQLTHCSNFIVPLFQSRSWSLCFALFFLLVFFFFFLADAGSGDPPQRLFPVLQTYIERSLGGLLFNHAIPLSFVGILVQLLTGYFAQGATVGFIFSAEGSRRHSPHWNTVVPA